MDREHLGDYLHHPSMANGSVAELETHLLIALRLSLVGEADVSHAFELTAEVSKMLAGLTKSLRQRVSGT